MNEKSVDASALSSELGCSAAPVASAYPPPHHEGAMESSSRQPNS
jgi:hypothetical protein